MLVKLAFVMQRLKIYPKKFLSLSTKMGGQFLDFRGDTAVMRGDIELMAGPPSPPPTKENPGNDKGSKVSSPQAHICQQWLQTGACTLRY